MSTVGLVKDQSCEEGMCVRFVCIDTFCALLGMLFLYRLRAELKGLSVCCGGLAGRTRRVAQFSPSEDAAGDLGGVLRHLRRCWARSTDDLI